MNFNIIPPFISFSLSSINNLFPPLLLLHSRDIGYEIIILKINFTNVQINSMRFASIVDEPINWIIGSPLTEYRPTFPNALALKTCFTFETCEFLSCDSHKFIRLRLHPTVVKITIGNGITCIYRKSFSRMQIWIRARRLGLFPHFPRLFWLVKTRIRYPDDKLTSTKTYRVYIYIYCKIENSPLSPFDFIFQFLYPNSLTLFFLIF